MSCEHLVCAACTGPVVDGGCPVCRAARAHVHEPGPLGISPQLLVLLVALIAVVTLVAAHLHG